MLLLLLLVMLHGLMIIVHLMLLHLLLPLDVVTAIVAMKHWVVLITIYSNLWSRGCGRGRRTKYQGIIGTSIATVALALRRRGVGRNRQRGHGCHSPLLSLVHGT